MSGGDAMLKACEANGTLVSLQSERDRDSQRQSETVRDIEREISPCILDCPQRRVPWVADAGRVSPCLPGRVKLVINHNRRWENVQRKLQAAIAAGDLGQLTSAEVVWPSVRLILSLRQPGAAARTAHGL